MNRQSQPSNNSSQTGVPIGSRMSASFPDRHFPSSALLPAPSLSPPDRPSPPIVSSEPQSLNRAPTLGSSSNVNIPLLGPSINIPLLNTNAAATQQSQFAQNQVSLPLLDTQNVPNLPLISANSVINRQLLNEHSLMPTQLQTSMHQKVASSSDVESRIESLRRATAENSEVLRGITRQLDSMNSKNFEIMDMIRGLRQEVESIKKDRSGSPSPLQRYAMNIELPPAQSPLAGQPGGVSEQQNAEFRRIQNEILAKSQRIEQLQNTVNQLQRSLAAQELDNKNNVNKILDEKNNKIVELIKTNQDLKNSPLSKNEKSYFDDWAQIIRSKDDQIERYKDQIARLQRAGAPPLSPNFPADLPREATPYRSYEELRYNVPQPLGRNNYYSEYEADRGNHAQYPMTTFTTQRQLVGNNVVRQASPIIVRQPQADRYPYGFPAHDPSPLIYREKPSVSTQMTASMSSPFPVQSLDAPRTIVSSPLAQKTQYSSEYTRVLPRYEYLSPAEPAPVSQHYSAPSRRYSSVVGRLPVTVAESPYPGRLAAPSYLYDRACPFHRPQVVSVGGSALTLPQPDVKIVEERVIPGETVVREVLPRGQTYINGSVRSEGSPSLRAYSLSSSIRRTEPPVIYEPYQL